jgi:Fibronectin type III domain
LTLNERAAVNAYLDGKYDLVPFVSATPSNLVAGAISGSQIGLTWSEPLDSGTTQVSIERSTNTSSGFAAVALVADSLSYVDTNLTAGATYYYRARAINVNTWSPYSNTTNATTFTNAADIPYGNLVLWLKADSGLAQIGTNTPVQFWTDQSGNGNNLIQSSANIVTRQSWTNQPLWVAGATGGFPVVHFTFGANNTYEYLFTYSPVSGMDGATNLEAFAVVRVTTNSPPGQRGLWYYGGASSSSEAYPATNGILVDGFGSTAIHSFTPTITLTNYHVYEVLSQSNNWSAWINGVLQYATNSNPVSIGNSFGLGAAGGVGNMTQGAPSGNPFSGDVAEVLIFNRGLTAAQRATVVTNYLFPKYNILH